MTFTPHGKYLAAGEWVGADRSFSSAPAHGPAHEFSAGTVDLVNRAVEAAEEAFWSYGYATREERAAFLDAIADEIETRADAITEIGTQETGLPEARLQGERGDMPLARRLMPVLERKVGRVLANDRLSGGEVCDAMVHGGPYPASTNFGATSVGTRAIRRFLRPVCFQNLPEALLPEDLRD